MRSLILKFMVFMAPLGALFAFPAWVMFASGEFTSYKEILALSEEKQPVLVEFAYGDTTGYLKLAAVQKKKPEIIALGTSRVMQFQKEFFNRSFYNAGSGHYSLFDDLALFLEQIEPGSEPKLLILGLDHKFFNPNWKDPVRDAFHRMDPATQWPRMVLTTWHKVYLDLFQGKIRLFDILHPRPDGIRRIGLGAIFHDAGFRNDGSHIWYWWERQDVDLGQIANNEYVYVWGDSVSEKSFEEVETFLKKAKSRGIHVAGFMPPFSPQVYRALQEHSERYVFVFKASDRLRVLFKKYDFSFEDFTDPARFHMEKDGFYDGEHASEKAYRRLWRSWTEKDPILKSFSSE